MIDVVEVLMVGQQVSLGVGHEHPLGRLVRWLRLQEGLGQRGLAVLRLGLGLVGLGSGSAFGELR